MASTFICVFDMGIDTMLGCFAEAELSMTEGERAPMSLSANMPDKLTKVLENGRNDDAYKAKQVGACMLCSQNPCVSPVTMGHIFFFRAARTHGDGCVFNC